ncbi:MAG: O-antigen ligase family protein [Defluviitaleaceae bacterium]|nr:O-antigen ligase family protein [Defluviitaleaceae bacterium]
MQKKNEKKENKNKKNKIYTPNEKPVTLRDKVFGAMLLIVIGIMPIVVRHTHVMSAPELTALIGWETRPDFFAFYKGWALGIPAIIMAFYAISDWLITGLSKNKIIDMIKPPPIAAACVFLFMALVSTIFSSYRHTSWFGAVERGEGMFTLLAYFIVFFSAMYFAKTDKHVKTIMYGLAFSSIIMGLIGFSQFVGRDFFATTLGGWFVFGTWGDIPSQSLAHAYGTLYNSNTFGIYTAMTAPILLACALVYNGRKWVRAIFLAGGVLMLIGVMGSGSVGGLIGTATAVAVTVVTVVCRFFYQKRQRKHDNTQDEMHISTRSTFTWVVSGVVLVALMVGLFAVPMVNQRLHFLLGRVQHAMRREVVPTYNYIVEDNHLTVQWHDNEIFTLILSGAQPNGIQWDLYDAAGHPIPQASQEVVDVSVDGGNITSFAYNIPGHRNLTLINYEHFVVVHNLVMLLHEGRIHALNANNNDFIDLTVPIPAIGFTGNETWGSGRGHIWSRTIPLMPRRTIIGSGPDTYALIFPQHDVIGKMRFHASPYIPLGMAHNVYMQTWVTTGGVSALALIFLFGYYLLTTFISVVRSRMREGVFVFGLRFGLLAGISAFCVSALATDSTIGSSGVFYLLLGLGCGVNVMVNKIYQAEPVN